MNPSEAARYVVVGLGGVGGLVLRLLVPFLHHHVGRATVVCVDGDDFEERNRARMFFDALGPKATVLARERLDRRVVGERASAARRGGRRRERVSSPSLTIPW